MRRHLQTPHAVTTLFLGLSLIAPAFAGASPLTINLQGRLTKVCEFTTSGYECAPVPGVVYLPIVATFDAEAVTIRAWGTGWLFEEPSARVDIGLPILPNPFGGTTQTLTSAQATFVNSGNASFKDGGIVTSQYFRADVCGLDGLCGSDWWVMNAGFGNRRVGPPFSEPPTVADLEAFIFYGGNFSLESRAETYDPIAHTHRIVIGSRTYFGNIPEPPVLLLSLAACALTISRHRRRRVGQCRPPTPSRIAPVLDNSRV